MAIYIPNVRKVNAKLVNADIDTYGVTFAIQPPYNADGFSSVNISVEQVPNNIKSYLEGNTALTIYAVPINVDKLCKGALMPFPSITDLYLFSLTMVDIEQEDDNEYLSYLSNLSVIYVPQALLSQYQATYPNLTFNEINVDYSYTIEQPSAGVDTLTSEIITNDLENNLRVGQRNAITKLIISSDFINNVDNVVWSYNFATLLPNLNNNIWYNNVKYDFTQRTLSGSDELLESDIANFIATIGNDKRSGVTQLHFDGFSDMSVALTYDYSALPNLAYIWLDNVRYDVSELEDIIYGYQKVEYIESTGGQCIDTLLNVPENVSFDFKFQITEKRYDGHILSARDTYACYAIFGFNNTIGMRYGDGGSTSNSFIWEINTDYICTSNYKDRSQTLTLNGINLLSNSNPYVDGMGKFWMFVLPSANHPMDGYYSKAKLYYCKIYDNDILVRDFIPCYRLNDNEIGLYDKVNNVFYINQGTGDFLKGNDSGYKPTYFYSIADLETEYDARLTQTFYLDYNGTLPSYPNYQLTYYTDINCTTTISTSDMVSGTRYYIKAISVE